MTIKSLLHWAADELAELPSARLDAELILSYILGKDRPHLMAHDEEKVILLQVRRFRHLIKRRKTGLPVAYILGHKEFYGLNFKVNKYVLIPRPDTEILVEAVLAYMNPDDLLLDIGTGTGCIPIAVLKNKSKVKAIATDISKKALMLASENADLHQVLDRVYFLQSDLLEQIPEKLFKGREVVLTANLPYVPNDYPINEEAEFEPDLALFADDNGLELYQKLFDQLEKVKPKAIFLECYDFQVEPLTKKLKNYRKKEVKPMLGEARMVMLEKI